MPRTSTLPAVAFLHPTILSPLRTNPQVLRRSRYLCCAKPPPGNVKPIFYKNPSKAIQKGGGFFIPGLRGPRLRFFVVFIATSLLTINHLNSSVASPTLANSETLAALSISAVFSSALFDVFKSYRDLRNIVSPRSDPAPDTASDPSLLDASPSSRRSDQNSWAITVCKDLTPVTHIAHFRNGVLQLATDNVPAASLPGEAVHRVATENRPLYITDTSTLPPQVSFPFLTEGIWSVFLVPNGDKVSVFAKSAQNGLSVEDRRWLLAFANHYF